MNVSVHVQLNNNVSSKVIQSTFGLLIAAVRNECFEMCVACMTPPCMYADALIMLKVTAPHKAMRCYNMVFIRSLGSVV